MHLKSPKISNRCIEHAEFARLHSIDGVEVLNAKFRQHKFSAHTHDAWAVGAVLRGAQDLASRGSCRNVFAGEISVIPPGEVHAGRIVGNGYCEYVMLYLPDVLMQKQAVELGIKKIDVAMHSFANAALSKRLGAFVKSVIESDSGESFLKTELLDLLTILVPSLNSGNSQIVRDSGKAVLSDALAFLHENWAKPVTLDQIAARANMSPAYFCRLFSSTYGLPPHRYQLVLRVNRAKRMLAQGGLIADVATATGFADQSHLGRHLKSCLGITPSAARNGSWCAKTF